MLAHSSFALDSAHLFYADDERHLISVAFVNRYVKPDHITPLTIVLNASARAAN
jgi:hypothetical protein